MANKSIAGLGLSLEAKLVSTNGRLFPSGDEKNYCAAFCTIRLDVLQVISAPKIEDLTCLCSTLCRI